MTRKIRSDCSLEKAAKKMGISEDAFRNKDDRKTRKDKKIGTIRKEFSK